MNKKESTMSLFDECQKLTPLNVINNMIFKRDDYFSPFSDIPLNGGKLRQAISLLISEYDNIKEKNENKVVTTNGIKSPQGIILARCCKELNLDFTMVMSGLTTKYETVINHNIVRHILNLNGKIDFSAYYNWDKGLVLYAKEKYEKAFLVKFGININDSTSIIECNSNQTKNLPTSIENLIIPVGSGITMAGIIRGLKQNKIKTKRIIGIQVGGHDYRKTIDALLGIQYYIPYEYVITGGIKEYGKEKEIILDNNVRLDPLYEAKAFSYVLTKRQELLTKDSVFWIVGNAYNVKHLQYAPYERYKCENKIISLDQHIN